MKYIVSFTDRCSENVESDTFDTNACLVVFYNIGAVTEGHKYATQIGVAAFPLGDVKSILAIE